MELVDPTKRETQRNHPAPHVDPAFAEEVNRIFGLNRYGEPNVRLAWGQERRQHALGDPEALLYVDTRLDPLVHERHTLRRVTFVETVTVEAGLDPATGEPAFETREIRHWEVVDCEPNPAVIPAGYVYACEWGYEWIGEQLWYAEQWVPPEQIAGGEPAWNAQRFGPDVHMRTGKFDPFLDLLGPYPRRGEYESRIVIGEPYAYPVVDEVPTYAFRWDEELQDTVPTHQTGVELVKSVEEHKRYHELGRDVLEMLRAAKFDQVTRDRKSAMQRQADALYNYNARLERRAAADRDYTRRAFLDRMRHAANPSVSRFNPDPVNRPAGRVIAAGE